MRPDGRSPTRLVIVGCGALARELARPHRGHPRRPRRGRRRPPPSRPERIADAVAAKIGTVRERYGCDVSIFVAYADCGTGGVLDAYLEREGIERIAGAHCYEFYAGAAAYEAPQDEELGTFYLTDFLARQFESIIWPASASTAIPSSCRCTSATTARLVYLAQTDDPELTATGPRGRRPARSRVRASPDRFGDLAPPSTHAVAAGAA